MNDKYINVACIDSNKLIPSEMKCDYESESIPIKNLDLKAAIVTVNIGNPQRQMMKIGKNQLLPLSMSLFLSKHLS